MEGKEEEEEEEEEEKEEKEEEEKASVARLHQLVPRWHNFQSKTFVSKDPLRR